MFSEYNQISAETRFLGLKLLFQKKSASLVFYNPSLRVFFKNKLNYFFQHFSIHILGWFFGDDQVQAFAFVSLQNKRATVGNE